MTWVNTIIQGLFLGSLYALLACGLSLLFGVMKVINLAHGDLGILGAFIAVTLIARGHLPMPLAIVLTLLIAAALGYLLQRGILSPALKSGELSPLLATFGLAIVIQNGLLQTFSSNSHSIDTGWLETFAWRVSPELSIPALSVATLLVAVVVLGGLHLMLKRTKLGRAMRAASSDVDTARLVGVDSQAVYAAASAIAIATAALGGIFLAMRSSFDPSSGPTQLLFAFEAVVIGGLGSLWGTLIGGIVLGLAQTLGAQFDPAYSIVAGHLVFLAVLVFRPRGIYAVKGRA